MLNFQATSSRIDILINYLAPDESPVGYHGDALAYWEAKRRGRVAPAWKDISLLDFPPNLIPLIAVTDISAGPLTSVFRFWGTGLTTAYGGDYTGQSPAEVPPKGVGSNIHSSCERLLVRKIPMFQVKEYMNQDGLFGRALCLWMPLSDDGEVVNHGLGVFYFESAKADQPFSKFFEAALEPVEH